MEIEAKYRITDEATYRHFCEREAWPPPLDEAEWLGEDYLAVYYDSPDAEVSAAFSSVRLRMEGGRRVLTCKWPVESPASLPEGGAAHCRGEFNLSLRPEQAEDWQAFIRSQPELLAELPENLRGLLLSDRLRARYRADFVRRSAQFDYGEARLELAVDKGRLWADGREAELCELECELLDGDVEALNAFCLWLEKQDGLALLPQSKFSRLLELERGEGGR